MGKNESLKSERWAIEERQRARKKRRNETAMVVEGKYEGTRGETEGRRRLWREGGG